MYETKNYETQELTYNKFLCYSLTSGFGHQLAEGRKEQNKTHAETCEITGNHQH